MYMIKCYKENIIIPIYVDSVRSLCSFVQNNVFFYEKLVIVDLERIPEEKNNDESL